MEMFQPWHLMPLVLVAFFFLSPFWKIFGKAGFPPALSLLLLLPVANLVVLYVIAFSPWKTPSPGART